MNPQSGQQRSSKQHAFPSMPSSPPVIECPGLHKWYSVVHALKGAPPPLIRTPKHAMRLGIETIYQYNAMVPMMSIARNVFIGREPIRWGLFGFGLLAQKRMRKES